VTLVLRAVIRTMGAEEEVLNAVTGVEIFHSLHLITLLRERERKRERERFLRRMRLGQRHRNNRRLEMQKCDAG